MSLEQTEAGVEITGGTQDMETDNSIDTGIESQTEMRDVTQAEEVTSVESCPPRPSNPEDEYKIIKDLEAEDSRSGMVLGQMYYLIPSQWYENWEAFVKGKTVSNYDVIGSFGTPATRAAATSPGPIDNTTLVKTGTTRLRDGMMEGQDFITVCGSMWRTFVSWYGGEPELARPVVLRGTRKVIEVSTLFLHVFRSTQPTKKVKVEVSKAQNAGEWKRKLCEEFDLIPNRVDLIDYYNERHAATVKLNETLEQNNIIDGQDIMLEELGDDGKPVVKRNPSNSSYFGSNYNTNYGQGQPVTPGMTGLNNLGNTCFMNSSLQCLVHTRPLMQFFSQGNYRDQINEDNPLGTGGRLVTSFGSLMENLWSGSSSSVAPREFKRDLEQFAPQFAGYQQHDSQELLAFLLDGIHEDVNRIKKKPYIENPEVGDRRQEEVAREAWAAHRSRNDSVIVDNFQGQLRSTLVCPSCDRVSITFDPFMYLSLPIPVDKTKIYEIILYLSDVEAAPVRLACQVPKGGTILQLKQSISKLTKIPVDNVVLCQISSLRPRAIEKHIDEDSDTIDEYLRWRSSIVAYELDTSLTAGSSDAGYFAVSWSGDGQGFPFILPITNANQITYKELYDLVYARVRRYLKVPTDKVYRTMEDLRGETDSAEESTSSREATPSRTVPRNEDSDSDEEIRVKPFDTSTDDEEVQAPQKKKLRNSTHIFDITGPTGSRTYELVDNDKPLNLMVYKNSTNTLYIKMSKEVYRSIYNSDVEKPDDHATFQEVMETEKEKAEKPISLGDCIALFSEEEELGPDDPWYCSKCKEFRQATKKFDLWSLPPILVVHLKRFFHRSRYQREKLDTTVDFPITGLDLSHHTKGPSDVPAIYDLYAVSNHFGGMGGGHYTAFAKNKDDRWYKFDDSYVSNTSEGQLVDGSAYVLFYQRRDLAEAAARTPEGEGAMEESDDGMSGNTDE
ncbi:ubiquitin carboxyl-terminal hydrolase 4 isoform 1 [Planoprotostelium fungivorum]|uniref:Ubiquitin carboxyl-terminal hydrolase n=1 Tax=Planoprotostelium fungivorum TaxID=1890364 RepID=A0A2P6NEB8_9EUKA|nr:ubiquitin carboxyl-terminal hydrolase 4 isoform 1 [Planoprotostelium fungivorum]